MGRRANCQKLDRLGSDPRQEIDRAQLKLAALIVNRDYRDPYLEVMFTLEQISAEIKNAAEGSWIV